MKTIRVLLNGNLYIAHVDMSGEIVSVETAPSDKNVPLHEISLEQVPAKVVARIVDQENEQ